MHDDQNSNVLDRSTADLDPFGSGWGNRYIDDLILRRIDRDLDDEYDEAWYHLTDVQFSTVAVTGLNARVHERVTYDAYGRARHHWGHDVNGDGAITTSGAKSDFGIIAAIVLGGGATITDATYRAEADINRDGVINGSDEAALGSAKTALAPGEISDRSATGPDSTIGWCGYVFVPETKFYHVRFRVYDTGLGRWKSRDPLEYVDGMGVYAYVRSLPLVATDPLGLDSGISPGRPLPSIYDYWSEEALQRMQDSYATYRKWIDERRKWNETDDCPEGLAPLWVCKAKLLGDDGIGGPQSALHHAYLACRNPFTWDPDDRTDDPLLRGKHPHPDGTAFRFIPVRFPQGPGGIITSPLFAPGYIVDDYNVLGRDPRNARCRKRCVDPDCKERACQIGPSPTPYVLFWDNCKHWADEVCPDLSDRGGPSGERRRSSPRSQQPRLLPPANQERPGQPGRPRSPRIGL